MEACLTVKQRCKNIMDDVARKVIIMQKCLGQPVHLRIMRFEKLLYVVSVPHTLIRHITSAKLNP